MIVYMKPTRGQAVTGQPWGAGGPVGAGVRHVSERAEFELVSAFMVNAVANEDLINVLVNGRFEKVQLDTAADWQVIGSGLSE